MIEKFPYTIFLYGYCLTMLSCSISNPSERLLAGDLLFQDLNCGALCDAIETVTEGVNGKDFSHCGMVVLVNDTLKVIEAIGDAVQINSLKTFFARSGDTAIIKNITIARVKKQFMPLIDKAMTNAMQKIGQPYDEEFLLDNGSWYCSELLYEAFKYANGQKDFFELAPMTYNDPATKQYFPAWIDYYKHLKAEIPEGKLGLNPGAISRSNKIEIIEFESLKK